MSPFAFGIFLIVVVFVWLAILTFWIYRVWSHYTGLTKDVSGNSLQQILESLLTKYRITQENVQKIEEQLKKTNLKLAQSVQKVGVVKFNPFGDTGGEQSFALALLDEDNNGVVLLGLHSRDTTRVYVKEIHKGLEGQTQGFSNEELQAIEKAQRNRK